jgi:hypothetical protein
MPGTGNYTGTNVNSDYILNVADALYQLRDNTSELIDPKDIRDSVWTLWNRIDDVQITASQSLASASSYFTNPNPTSKEVGGIAVGTTFNGTYSVQQMFDLLLYPYTAPELAISASNTPRQFGSSLATTLTWSVTKKKLAITGIVVDGNTITPVNGGNQNGTTAATGTHSLSYNTTVSENQTFTMSVVDGTSTQYKTTVLNWRHKIFWGKIDLSSIGNPNLTTTPGQSANVATKCTDVVIKALTGAAVSPGYALATSYVKNYNGMDGGGQYIIFAFPTIFTTTAGRDPVFKINGAPNTAFTKVKSGSAFVTDTGLIVNYDVWVSNTAQNSPIDALDVT